MHLLSVTTGTTLEMFLDGLSEDGAAEAEALLEEYGNGLKCVVSHGTGGHHATQLH